MRVIVDTNVFLSGIFWSGNPGRILDAWGRRELTFLLSKEILEEYIRVGEELSRKYPRIDVSPFIDLLMVYAEFHEPTILDKPISRDPDDDKFIALALAAKCPYIVSGDNDLLSLKNIGGIEILKPADFVRRHLNI
jgi:putative PIN family toxin of toxin-antitoxin system